MHNIYPLLSKAGALIKVPDKDGDRVAGVEDKVGGDNGQGQRDGAVLVVRSIDPSHQGCKKP